MIARPPMKLAVAGAAGRMGRTLVSLIAAMPDRLQLVGALEPAGSKAIGQDAGVLAHGTGLGVMATADLDEALKDAEGILDFTLPGPSRGFAEAAAARGIVHVIGTTGFSADDDAAIARSAGRTPIVKSGNMSLGVNLLAAVTKRVAATLDTSFDIEIVEMHHRMKVDAPSGTALLLGEAAADGRGVQLSEAALRGRDGHTGARPEGGIGFASLRGGTVVGEHCVVFAGPSERIELGHRAEDRAIFARGALTAAQWARGKPPGLYSMADVLGLNDL